ncbi:hypothetical protein PVL29_024352 [Vitis rotundifolia]|uniref:Uncharacterized protein n=1 Tax=Vitis rotundifolia TaxID=103349 RepID=A0AA38YRL5_VITRO|nr:hypothetical protein PVL29_024352 [Vitis rotundifolia]
MAPQLLLSSPLTGQSQAVLAAATILLCAFALFMCASHSRKWRRLSGCYSFHDADPVIQVDSDAVFIARHGAQPVWQRNILMGGKCQLPDFSGVIIYDSAGNVVSNAKTSGATLSLK